MDYDEFGYFSENAAEWGLDFRPPAVRREWFSLEDGRRVSALVWGPDSPEVVLLHGGAQNAHTWDTVLLALDRPAVALDLPGHGHSDGPPAAGLHPEALAADVAGAVAHWAPTARVVVGMSLGGLTAMALAGHQPQLVSRLALVDITPGVDAHKARAITAFVSGPASFPDFDAILARTIEHNPTRSVSSLRRGILHNALQRDDGTWVWRYARHRVPAPGGARDYSALWETIGGLAMPVMLVRGMAPGSVVDDSDEAEFRRRLPSARIARVDKAGHSVQGDTPLELAALISDFAMK